ncbi:ght1 [Acrasis kona]|uniref:Ght1 n=1 Tax=Acrasis kona TaxID=1008807 RepID=A0AAW2YHE3_9EUKA
MSVYSDPVRESDLVHESLGSEGEAKKYQYSLLGASALCLVMGLAYTIFQIWAVSSPTHDYIRGRTVFGLLVALLVDLVFLIGVISQIPVIPEKVQQFLSYLYAGAVGIVLLALLFASSPWHASNDDWFEYVLIALYLPVAILAVARIHKAGW